MTVSGIYCEGDAMGSSDLRPGTIMWIDESRPGLAEMTRHTAPRPKPFRPSEHLLDQPESHQSHYESHGIQPVDYIYANGLGFAAGNVVKYVTRAAQKGGLEDLHKAQQYLHWMIREAEASNAS